MTDSGLDVLLYPDPALRRKAEPVDTFDDELVEFVDALETTADDSEGLGLSSIQVGDPRAVLVLRPTADPTAPRVYINPEIVDKGSFGVVEESCLSIPGISGLVLRATKVTVRAQDASGEHFECELAGMDAVSLQHEVDHLDGVLFIDRLSIVKRILLRLTGKTRGGA